MGSSYQQNAGSSPELIVLSGQAVTGEMRSASPASGSPSGQATGDKPLNKPPAPQTEPTGSRRQDQPVEATTKSINLNLSGLLKGVKSEDIVSVRLHLTREEAGLLMASKIDGVQYIGNEISGQIILTGEAMVIRQVLSQLVFAPNDNDESVTIRMAVEHNDVSSIRYVKLTSNDYHAPKFDNYHPAFSSGVSFFARAEANIKLPEIKVLEAAPANELVNVSPLETASEVTESKSSSITASNLVNPVSFPTAGGGGVSGSDQPGVAPAAPVTPPFQPPLPIPAAPDNNTNSGSSSGGGNAQQLTLNGIALTQAFTEETPLSLAPVTIQATGFTPTTVTATLSLSSAGAGALSVATSTNASGNGAVTSSYNAATGVWTATGHPAEVGELINGVTFTPAGNHDQDVTLSVKIESGSTSTIQFVTLDATGTQDAPVLSNAVADQTAAEDASFSFQVPVNAFTDPDSGDTLSYTATKSDGTALPGWLTFNAATRTFSGTPTNNEVGTLSLKVTAVDGHGGTVSDIFNVTVTNTNDAPTVANALSNQSATEDALFTYTVPINTFADVDVGDTFTYSATLSDGSALPAWLNFNAATRTFSGTPDNASVGTISVKVIADDGHGGSVSSGFTITTTNTNDNPTLANAIANQSATEDSSFTYTVPANSFADVDAGDTLTYTATKGDGSALPGWLSFNAATRTFSGTPLNADVGTLAVKVIATDGHGGTDASSTFNITVANTNDDPTVSNPITNQTAAEDSAFTYTIPANAFTDPDGDTLSFTATKSDGTALPSWLSFNAGTRTFSGTPLNGDVGTLSIKVTASDGTSPAIDDTFDITVTNTNDTPTALALSANSVAENSSNGTAIGALSTTDPDTGDTFTYSIAPGGDPSGKFAISGTNLVVNGALNYEATNSYNVTVRATDSGGAHIDQAFTIGITNVNEAPGTITDSNAAGNSVPENAVIGNNTGLTASATDPEGSAITYSLANDAGGKFSIDATTGVVKVAGALDFETATSHTITVNASDGTNNTTQDFTIAVTNSNDTPTNIAISTGNVDENSAIGTTIGTLSATDQDAAATFTYQIMSDPDAKFVLAGNQLKVNGLLNYEAKSSHDVQIKVTDNGGLTYTKTLTIGVNNINDVPVLANQTFQIAENSANGTQLTRSNGSAPLNAVTAFDEDGNSLTYSIVSGNAAGIFAMDAQGNLTVANGTLLDYETTTSYTLGIAASDGTATSATGFVTVNVTDVFENRAPVVNNQNMSVNDTVSGGAVVGTLAGTDPDGQSLTWSITAGNSAGVFALNSSTGVITVANAALLSSSPSYALTVQASDGTLVDDGVLTITLNEINDAPVNTLPATYSGTEDTALTLNGISLSDPDNPTVMNSVSFSVSSGQLNLATNISGGVTAGQVSGNGTGTVTITNGNLAAINATLAAAGLVFTPAANATANVTLTMTSTDVALSDTDTSTISLSAVNDAPVVATPIPVQSMQSDVTRSYTIPGGTFTDPDGDSMTYSVSYSSNDGATFTNGTPAFMTFNAATLVFDVASPPGNPNVDSYIIRVKATDSSNVSTTTDMVFNLTAVGLSFDSNDPTARQIIGTSSADVISGGANNDTLQAGAGNDTIYGNAGNDSIQADQIPGSGAVYGSDLVYGGDGNDTIYGESNDRAGQTTTDSLYGGNGHDLIYGWAGYDSIFGDAGNDTLLGGFSEDTIFGGDGNDSINGNEQNDILDGGIGLDTMAGGDGADTITGGADADQFNYIALTDSSNILTHDVITDFQAGIDKLRLPLFTGILEGVGVASDRTLEWYQTGTGGTAKTIIKSDGINYDFYLELTGHVSLAASDFIFWGTVGNNTNDTINGTSGDDAILGMGGNDSINAGAGTNQVWGGDGNDTIIATTGADMLDGGAGDDVIYGDYGANTILGGDGNDTLTNYHHTDSSPYIGYVTGGAGNDYFRFDYIPKIISNSNTIGTRITDFTIGEDKLFFDNLPFNDYYSGGTSTYSSIDYTKPTSLYGVYESASDLTKIYAAYGDYGRPALITLVGNYITNANPAENLSISDFVFNNYTDGNARDTDSRTNYIAGGTGADGIMGTSGNDTIFAGPGGDNIYTGDGDDLVVLKANSTSATSIAIGNGNDRVFMYGISGGAGSSMFDVSSSNTATSTIIAVSSIYNVNYWNMSTNTNTNSVYFVGSSSADNFYQHQGNDTLIMMQGGDGNFKGGAGNDWMDEGEGNSNFVGGESGNDTIIGGYGTETMAGSTGNDTYIFYDPLESKGSGSAQDLIQDLGNSGTDKIILYGFTGIGTGATELTITNYNTTQFGYFSQDFTDIRASNTDIDFKITLVGNKTLTVGSNLILNAGTIGTSAADTLSGSTGDDYMFGQLGNDSISSGDGVDSIFGGDGNDTLSSGDGNDSLSGGAGSDTLIGGAGADTLQGDSGTDTFKFTTADSSTTVTDLIFDFRAGNNADKIDLSDAGFDAIAPGGSIDFTDLIIETPLTLGGNYTKITLSGTSFAINLLGYYESGYNISASDFIF